MPKVHPDVLRSGDTAQIEAAEALVKALTTPEWPENRLKPNSKMTQRTLAALQAQATAPEVQNFWSCKFSGDGEGWQCISRIQPIDQDKLFSLHLPTPSFGSPENLQEETFWPCWQKTAIGLIAVSGIIFDTSICLTTILMTQASWMVVSLPFYKIQPLKFTNQALD